MTTRMQTVARDELLEELARAGLFSTIGGHRLDNILFGQVGSGKSHIIDILTVEKLIELWKKIHPGEDVPDFLRIAITFNHDACYTKGFNRLQLLDHATPAETLELELAIRVLSEYVVLSVIRACFLPSFCD